MRPRGLKSNLALVFASEMLNRVVSAVLLILVSRAFGPAVTGVYTVGTTLLFVGSRFALWGLDQILIRDVAVERVQAARYFANFFLLRLALSSGMGLILSALVWWVLPYAPAARLPLLIILWGLLPENLADICRAVFLALERTEYVLWANGLTALLKVGGAALAVWAGTGLVGVAWVMSGGGLLGALGGLILLLRQLPVDWRKPDWVFWRETLREGAPFWAINLSNILDSQVDLLFLPWFVSEAQIGLYGAGLGVFLALTVLPATFRMAIFPRIMQVFATDRVALERLYRQSLKYLTVVAAPISVGVYLVAGPVIRLIYGTAFAGAAPILQVLVWAILFLLPGDINSRLLLASRNQKRSAIYTAIGLMLNVLLILLLVPRFGILGAGWARFVSNVVVSVLNHLYVQKEIVQTNLLSLVWKPLLAVSIMGIVVTNIETDSLVLPMLSGALVYIFAIIALRVFIKSEISNFFRHNTQEIDK
jgi:O-antigen/teichoic acid export membrane protein